MEKADCLRIEERALNAWPGIQHALCNGWLMRFAHGYTRRANSVVPLYDGDIAVAPKVAACRAHYARRGLPTVFKMLSFARSEPLDAYLAAEGYHREAETSVQTRALDKIAVPTKGEVRIWDQPDLVWLEAYVRMNGVDGGDRVWLEEILDHIVPEVGYVLLYAGQDPVACGLGILEEGQVGLYSLVTDPAQRNRGYGRQLVARLCSWGKARGAHRAYLQVMRENDIARRLYSRLGFAEAYHYWYRVESI